MSEFPVADLVQDLAGLRVAVVVPILRLQRAQDVKRATGEVRIDQHVLQRNDQAVTAERGHKPWQPGGRQEDHVIRAGDGQPKRSHVLQGLPIKTIELLVAGADLQHGPQPIRQRFEVV